MAVTKILHMKESGRSKQKALHLQLGIRYILNPEKTESLLYVETFHCEKDTAFEEMISTKQFYGKETGRQGYHIMISFVPGEVDEETAFEIGKQFANAYITDDYEAVLAVHNDKKHLHIHLIFNSVSFRTGKKYHYANGDWEKEIQPITNQLCKNFGLSQIDLEDLVHERSTLTYNEWAGKRGSIKELLQKAIDDSVSTTYTYEAFLKSMVSKGYEIRDKKHLCFKPHGTDRFYKSEKLGIGYSKTEIIGRIRKNEVGRLEEELYMQPITKKRVRVVRGSIQQVKLTPFQAYQIKCLRLATKRREVGKRKYNYQNNEYSKLRLYEQQVLFLYRNHIHTAEELFRYKERLEQQENEVIKTQRSLYQRRRRAKEKGEPDSKISFYDEALADNLKQRLDIRQERRIVERIMEESKDKQDAKKEAVVRKEHIKNSRKEK